MLKRKQSIEQRFFLVFAGTLIIICMMVSIAVMRFNNPQPQSIPGSVSTASLPTLDILQTGIPATIAQAPLEREWQPLPPLSYDHRGLITSGNPSEFKLALTFDLCQREGELSGYDTEIVHILNETQTPATFFVGGQWMRDHEANARELGTNPLFELGNHSWSHLDFDSITPAEMESEILLTQQKMYELLGYQTNLFRLPYGTYHDEVLNVIAGHGLYTIQWNIVSGDPDPDIDAAKMSTWVLEQVQPGSIIIMHANGRGWHTAEALPEIIQSIRQQGYIFVTVSELLNIPPYK